MNLKKKTWYHCTLIGAIGYPLIIGLLYLLTYISSLIGINLGFQYVLLAAAYPVLLIGIELSYFFMGNIYKPFLFQLALALTVPIGALVGISAYIIKKYLFKKT